MRRLNASNKKSPVGSKLKPLVCGPHLVSRIRIVDKRGEGSPFTPSASYCPDERWTVSIPPFIVLRRLTYSSGRVQRRGTFNPIKLAMLPMNDVQLDVSAFQTGEVACNCLI
jgi:hypothetical protein